MKRQPRRRLATASSRRRASRASRFRANLRFLPRFENKSEIGQVPERSAWSWSNHQTGVGVVWQKTLRRAPQAGVSRPFLSVEMAHPRGAADQHAR
jgi:hypothetical protein